ncbi:hypothetical protein D8830_06000 [Streptococcus intermedius]|uniref:hypothetical protein n=1 Tax=Streptococcus intermedius TaxID=1338 RepID=UPI000F9A5EFC|nr:hypothetical protein [Streptococcus intermedius]RSJ17858.1 hypothetical protein D8830_06000 [Streptococcus intermedius]
MSRWDELHQQERQLSYQLEEVSHRRFRAERILDDIEIYMSNNQSLEMELYEATYQSKYANQLEETSHQLMFIKTIFSMTSMIASLLSKLKNVGWKIRWMLFITKN